MSQDGVEIDQWVRDIPVWTKGHAVGKENADAVDGAADD